MDFKSNTLTASHLCASPSRTPLIEPEFPTTDVIHCEQSEITVSRIETDTILDIEIWWKSFPVVHLLCSKFDTKSTWWVRNRGETPQSWSVLRFARANVADCATAACQCYIQEKATQSVLQTAAMYTPPGPAENWALVDSVEDDVQEDEYGATSFVADDDNWQYSHAPTPAFGGDCVRY